ncbi:MAG: hypothetical protein KatS3mg111_1792 [Pirellulaceae bacterium]|nr:MAG: hypothetical protein KatS3mg111_1792 [Pirellulaceae bacterium]
MIPKQTIKRLVQWIILAVVAWGIWMTARKAGRDLSQQRAAMLREVAVLQSQLAEAKNVAHRQEIEQRIARLTAAADQFWQPRPSRLITGGLFYALGLFPVAMYWHACLHAVGQEVPRWPVWWAYVYGNLGKYFPGKAMVIVLRVAELQAYAIKRTAAAITVFMETLTLMAVGGAVSALSLIILGIDRRWTWLSLALLVGTFAPTLPPVLRWILPRLQSGIEPAIMQQWLERITWRLIFKGWLLAAITWLWWGLSLMFILTSLPLTEAADVSTWKLWLSSQAASALAVVLGFVSLVPGGAGVRELVLSVVLTPVVGPAAALSSAVWARIVWLTTELLAVALTALVGRHQRWSANR